MIEKGCRDTSWGCVDCKKRLIQSMEAFLTPLHERRAAIENDPERLRAIIESGNAKAREAARETIAQVRELLHFNF